MQSGKCWDKESIEVALIGAPWRTLSESASEESGVAKFFERGSRIGVSRSSSSSLGRARAASCRWLLDLVSCLECHGGPGSRTSIPLAKMVLKAARTMLSCSLTGT